MSIISSDCSLTNNEIDINDIWNFKITITEAQENREAHLTGLLDNSAMGISSMETTIYNDNELNIIIFQKLAGSKYSGKLDKSIIIGKNISKVTFGSTRRIIWYNQPRQNQTPITPVKCKREWDKSPSLSIVFGLSIKTQAWVNLWGLLIVKELKVILQ